MMLKSFRLSPVAGLLAVAALAVWPVMASAESSGAHFASGTSVSVANSGALVVHIDEAGLGGTKTNYTLSAEATATYKCINGGENHPKATNKETRAGKVTGGTSLAVKHGRAEGDIEAGPLSAGSFTCPSGQTLVLAAVSYSKIVLTDTTNNVIDNLGSVERNPL